MKEEVFETVLNELLEDQKQLTLASKDLCRQVTLLAEKVAGFDQRLNTQIVAPPADTSRLEQLIKDALLQITLAQTEGLKKINQQVAAIEKQLNETLTTGLQNTNTILEAQPKPIVRQWRISFFPESDRQGSYRLFLNRVTLVICILAVLIGLCWLGRIWLDNIHSERTGVSPVSRGPFPATPSASPHSYAYPSPNSSPVTHHHHPANSKKKTADSLLTTFPAATDSAHIP